MTLSKILVGYFCVNISHFYQRNIPSLGKMLKINFVLELLPTDNVDKICFKIYRQHLVSFGRITWIKNDVLLIIDWDMVLTKE